MQKSVKPIYAMEMHNLSENVIMCEIPNFFLKDEQEVQPQPRQRHRQAETTDCRLLTRHNSSYFQRKNSAGEWRP